MDSKEVLTLIQLALGKASVAFMSQPDGGKIVMPTEKLLETANELCEAIMAMARKDYARIAELEEASREVLRTWDHYGVIYHLWDIEPLRTALGLPAPKAKGGE